MTARLVTTSLVTLVWHLAAARARLVPQPRKASPRFCLPFGVLVMSPSAALAALADPLSPLLWLLERVCFPSCSRPLASLLLVTPLRSQARTLACMLPLSVQCQSPLLLRPSRPQLPTAMALQVAHHCILHGKPHITLVILKTVSLKIAFLNVGHICLRTLRQAMITAPSAPSCLLARMLPLVMPRARLVRRPCLGHSVGQQADRFCLATILTAWHSCVTGPCASAPCDPVVAPRTGTDTPWRDLFVSDAQAD